MTIAITMPASFLCKSNRYSSWIRLFKVQVWPMRFKEQLPVTNGVGQLGRARKGTIIPDLRCAESGPV